MPSYASPCVNIFLFYEGCPCWPECHTKGKFSCSLGRGWYQSWSLLEKSAIIFASNNCLQVYSLSPNSLLFPLILEGNSALISQHYILHQLYYMAHKKILSSVYQKSSCEMKRENLRIQKISLSCTCTPARNACVCTHTHPPTHSFSRLFFAGVSVKSYLNLNVEQ